MGIRILHANPNVLMQSGFSALMFKGGGVDKIETAQSESELFDHLKSSSFDLVVIDPINNSGFTVGSAIKLKDLHANQKVLVISEVKETAKVLMILEKGVQGYLTRECDQDEIIHAVFSICKGENFYCNKVLDLILNKSQHEGEENCEPMVLSERENEVTALIARGLTNKEIGEKLHLSHHTIHTHRKNILKKLGVRSVSELTLYAMNVGLLN